MNKNKRNKLLFITIGFLIFSLSAIIYLPIFHDHDCLEEANNCPGCNAIAVLSSTNIAVIFILFLYTSYHFNFIKSEIKFNSVIPLIINNKDPPKHFLTIQK